MRFTFDKPAEKINGRVSLASSHVTVCDFLGLVKSFFFFETLHENLPVARAKQLDRSIKKTNSYKRTAELPG